MAHEYTVRANQFKKMELTPTEYAILRVAEDHRAGREVGAVYGGIHSQDEDLTSIEGYVEAVQVLDDNGIIEPYGHPFRFILTEKGRLLLYIYELEH